MKMQKTFFNIALFGLLSFGACKGQTVDKSNNLSDEFEEALSEEVDYLGGNNGTEIREDKVTHKKDALRFMNCKLQGQDPTKLVHLIAYDKDGNYLISDNEVDVIEYYQNGDLAKKSVFKKTKDGWLTSTFVSNAKDVNGEMIWARPREMAEDVLLAETPAAAMVKMALGIQ